MTGLVVVERDGGAATDVGLLHNNTVEGGRRCTKQLPWWASRCVDGGGRRLGGGRRRTKQLPWRAGRSVDGEGRRGRLQSDSGGGGGWIPTRFDFGDKKGEMEGRLFNGAV
ncbi:ACT domain repeat 3 [Striga asiatica]|uniref:ACT domain repeat 3 n=1 Tax=Striga asiatica TaxID=4170 RepID=A0A5A7PN79_STRAF|nr:ACT domain repeat 3 [Striga asiatica]